MVIHDEHADEDSQEVLNVLNGVRWPPMTKPSILGWANKCLLEPIILSEILGFEKNLIELTKLGGPRHIRYRRI